jgi:hypothetical protein
MYYARNPIRLTFEDADWGTLTDEEGSKESGQALSSHESVPTKPFLRPTAEESTRDLQDFEPLASALSAAAEVRFCEEELNKDQHQHPVPGAFTWTRSRN